MWDKGQSTWLIKISARRETLGKHGQLPERWQSGLRRVKGSLGSHVLRKTWKRTPSTSTACATREIWETLWLDGGQRLPGLWVKILALVHTIHVPQQFVLSHSLCFLVCKRGQ